MTFVFDSNDLHLDVTNSMTVFRKSVACNNNMSIHNWCGYYSGVSVQANPNIILGHLHLVFLESFNPVLARLINIRLEMYHVHNCHWFVIQTKIRINISYFWAHFGQFHQLKHIYLLYPPIKTIPADAKVCKQHGFRSFSNKHLKLHLVI